MSYLEWLVTFIYILALPEKVQNCHPAPAAAFVEIFIYNF
jgi:hypothetical protein